MGIVQKKVNPHLKIRPTLQIENKIIGYCQLCGSKMISMSEDDTCDICKSYFEDEERQNRLRNIYHEFKDFIDYNSDFKEIIDEENKYLKSVSGK